MPDIYTLPTAENPEGTRIPVGQKTDPNIIGPDDHVSYEMRKPHEIKDVPEPLLHVEAKYILPMARTLSNHIGITCLQEAQYGNVQEQIRQRSLFVVLNVLKGKIENGVATYFGLILMCKRHAVVRLVCKCHLATERFGVAEVHVWRRDLSLPDGGEYIVHRGRDNKPIPLDTIPPLLMNYLENKEKILND